MIFLREQDEGLVDRLNDGRVDGRIGVPEQRWQETPELVGHQDFALGCRVTNGLSL